MSAALLATALETAAGTITAGQAWALQKRRNARKHQQPPSPKTPDTRLDQ